MSDKLILHTTKVNDAYVLEHKQYPDDRGYFQEMFNETNIPIELDWQGTYQINTSLSHKNVIRGIHVVPFSKIVSCVKGKIFDVVVDLRPYSKTFLKWDAIWLKEKENKQLLIPPNCGHGFFAANKENIVVYMQDEPYNPISEKIVNWADPKLGIKWPKVENDLYILSKKDRDVRFLK